ncbi:DNA-processing protein DprA [Endozoicomonas sp. SCSIO W0465]|uniref:DNA-processing protein DprA n=1 Tax=Endozoicomonas sp. SCSIO W0465 TaxID=2918516 RepID=UPI002075C145|nr:DNA-processing protein DprA [Endozoicomonas sp. SCSIO W0465]USE36692.1 DNA-processing protein DprA [Endozoicomonas sp. SCSIO W0465]
MIYTDTDQKDWLQLLPWLTLSLIPGLGPIKSGQLIEKFQHPGQLFSASLNELKRIIPDKLASLLVNAHRDTAIQKQLHLTNAWLQASQAHTILTPDSPLYPKTLKELPDAPVVLYVIGNRQLLSEPQLGVVGSRRPTPNGRRVAREFCEHLSRSGLVITSGLALGIDAAAHQGALGCYGGTVAVLGTGVDQVYPARHKDLYQLIAGQGAIVSEYPLGTKPFAGNFPRRNRILSGLSLGVLVVEAALESGSLISARLAAEQGREVFAIPGSVLNPLSRGCHKLIREGAVLVESPDDVLIELAPQLHCVINEFSPPTATRKEIDPLRLKVIEVMGFDVVSADQISTLSGIPFAELSVVLTEMELDGVIESTSGGFIRLG